MTTELTTTTTALMPAVYPADQNPALVYLASLSEGSRRTMTEALNVIANLAMPGSDLSTFPWHLLRFQHTQAIRTRLSERYSPATVIKMLSALRKTLKNARRLGQMSSQDYEDAVDLDPISGHQVDQADKGRALKPGELAALMRACDDGSKAGVRDAAIIAVAYTAGLRRAELAALRLEDWNGADDECILTVHGKGNKKRVVPLAESACDALFDWLSIRGPWSGALFTHVHRGDHVLMDGLTDQAIYKMLARRAEQAKVKKFSPHDLRRTFAGDLLDAGADIATVQKLMGHASVVTTAGYDRRDAKAKRAAVNKLHIPYRRQFQ